MEIFILTRTRDSFSVETKKCSSEFMPSEVGFSLTKDYNDGFMLDSKYTSECRGHELYENGHALPFYGMSLCYNGFVRVIFVKDPLIWNYIEGFVLDSK